MHDAPLEYKNLNRALKANSDELSKNREKIREHEKTLGLQSLTMNQLQSRAQSLQKQLNDTAQSLHPEAYRQLSGAESVTVLRDSISGTDDALHNMVETRADTLEFSIKILQSA